MKTPLSLAAAVVALTGCVAVPVGPGSGPYYLAPPPPMVVVRPYPYYSFYGGYGYGHGPRWHRRWRY